MRFAAVFGQLLANFIGYGLDLAGVRTCADDESVSERSNAAQVENDYLTGFLGFGRPDGNQPGGWGLVFRQQFLSLPS